MTKQRRVFSDEFKREAADLVLTQNYSFIEASRSLGIGEWALRRWVGQLQQERIGIPPKESLALTLCGVTISLGYRALDIGISRAYSLIRATNTASFTYAVLAFSSNICRYMYTNNSR